MKESITPSGEPYVPKCEDAGKGSHRNRHKHSQDVRPQIHIPGVDEGFVGDPKSYTTWESPFGKKKNRKVQVPKKILQNRATWMKPEDRHYYRSEISQFQKDKYYIIPLL